jgi:hypothetical protein
LNYALKVGASEKTILEQAKRQRGPIPQVIVDAPELQFGLEWVYSAFGKLTTCRSVGMGIGPIPWTAINEFALRYGLSEDDQDDFEFLIEQMDDAYVKHMNEKSEKEKGIQAQRTPLRGQTTARRR